MTKILKKTQLSENVFRMTLEAPLIARERKAGQFIILRTNAEWGERIPLTIADADAEAGTIDIIFQTVGASTKELATYNAGDSIADLVGPLGKPTEIECLVPGAVVPGWWNLQTQRHQAPSTKNQEPGAKIECLVPGAMVPNDSTNQAPGTKNQEPGTKNQEPGTKHQAPQKGWVVVVGGGIGVAPAHPIAQAFKAAGNRVTAIMGARTKELIIMEDEMRRACDEVVIVTDDGSYGRKALVTEPLKEFCEMSPKPDEVVIVGPPIMMKFAALATKPYGVKTIASLNSIMIDGTGMCGGCRVTVGGKTKFVCVDGPEFDAHQVDFDNFIKRLGTFKPEEAAHKCRSGVFG